MTILIALFSVGMQLFLVFQFKFSHSVQNVTGDCYDQC